ncbi:hypothetical protein QBC34DRAFT_472288 [Podospora aff. communis PSN243]|uniref:Microbial-type PARG catalytic domain-containing protein n=1 Tax=Podospora aff. communis PSN243 TaxID=3040156 RepID=A0AAV9GB96_9PEZI|nr:hypothetical protein QBC34DRAFT_472288 [Podospora aff. communis PSN243]
MASSSTHQNRRNALKQTAKETKAMTPTIATSLPHLNPTLSLRFSLETLPPLDPTKCPHFHLSRDPSSHGTPISVLPSDSFDAAITMPSILLSLPSSPQTHTELEKSNLTHLHSSCAAPSNLNPSTAARVAVLNMASEHNPGGGWMNGAAAQEEALCFRSTLASSLHKSRHYPIPDRSGIWTKDVVIFRTSMAEGHELMVPAVEAERLPVVSVLSVAGIRRPRVESVNGKSVFAEAGDRELTRDKMRLCLRMAAERGHTMVVLGALGCGAFRNPPEEVAECWGEVLREGEFAGGWFRGVWFAVFDRKGDGNLPVFKRWLDGKVVGVVGDGV